MKKLMTLFSLLVAISVSMAFTPASGGYKVGDTATDFSLKGVDGKFVSMSDYKDAKGFIIIFTCNTCPVVKQYEDRINALHEKYADQGYPLIAINPNDPSIQPGDSMEKMKVRAKEKGFKFPYLFDAGQTVYPQYGATKTPHVFLLDASLIVRYIGAIDDNARSAESVGVKYLENAIAALEKGKNPDPNFTKAVGCSIKAKA